MSNSNINSNLVAKAGTETITNFATMGDTSTILSGSTVTANTTVTSGTNVAAGTSVGAATFVNAGSYVKATTYVEATTYMKIGIKKYLIITEADVNASVVAVATAISASLRGSIVLGKGAFWKFTSDTVATRV